MSTSMSPDVNPDLSQLRDIHLPAQVSWWPLAPGWWLLLAAVGLAVAGLLWWWRRRHNNRWRRQALQEIGRLRASPRAQDSVIALSVLLRRVAISQFPRHQVAALNGDAWLAFLDRTLGAGQEFMSDVGHMLSTAPYVQDAQIEAKTMHALFALSERWVRKLPTGVIK
jgi:hypothetical protein